MNISIASLVLQVIEKLGKCGSKEIIQFIKIHYKDEHINESSIQSTIFLLKMQGKIINLNPVKPFRYAIKGFVEKEVLEESSEPDKIEVIVQKIVKDTTEKLINIISIYNSKKDLYIKELEEKLEISEIKKPQEIKESLVNTTEQILNKVCQILEIERDQFGS